MLPASLAALGDAVDEVVVYDTGSSDRTVEIAREAGARVVLGYWDEHFGDPPATGRCRTRSASGTSRSTPTRC